MICEREELSADDLSTLVVKIGTIGRYPIADAKFDNHKIRIVLQLDKDLQLIFAMSDTNQINNEILIVKNTPRFTMIYHNREMQLIVNRTNAEFANVTREQEGRIDYDFYPDDDYWDRDHETRTDRLARRLRIDGPTRQRVGKRQGMDFQDLNSLDIEFYKYVQDQCILQYFRDNDFVIKYRNPHGPEEVQFVDFPIETI